MLQSVTMSWRLFICLPAKHVAVHSISPTSVDRVHAVIGSFVLGCARSLYVHLPKLPALPGVLSGWLALLFHAPMHAVKGIYCFLHCSSGAILSLQVYSKYKHSCKGSAGNAFVDRCPAAHPSPPAIRSSVLLHSSYWSLTNVGVYPLALSSGQR